MDNAENEPRSLVSDMMPTPMPKSALPCTTGDPLLSLTPEKPTRPLHNSTQGCTIRVERHAPMGVLTNNGISNADFESNVHKHSNQGLSRTGKTRTAGTDRGKESRSVRSRGQKCVRIAEPSKLSQPQHHTTNLVEQHLEVLQRQEFNGESVVMRALGDCETMRTAFAGKVAEGVNRPVDERKYSGLIAIDVPVQETIAQATEEKLSRVKVVQGAKKTSKVSEGPVPDILDIFTPDMIVEQPSFDVPSFPSADIQLEQAPADMAFNLYKHMKCWQST